MKKILNILLAVLLITFYSCKKQEVLAPVEDNVTLKDGGASIVEAEDADEDEDDGTVIVETEDEDEDEDDGTIIIVETEDEDEDEDDGTVATSFDGGSFDFSNLLNGRNRTPKPRRR